MCATQSPAVCPRDITQLHGYVVFAWSQILSCTPRVFTRNRWEYITLTAERDARDTRTVKPLFALVWNSIARSTAQKSGSIILNIYKKTINGSQCLVYYPQVLHRRRRGFSYFFVTKLLLLFFFSFFKIQNEKNAKHCSSPDHSFLKSYVIPDDGRADARTERDDVSLKENKVFHCESWEEQQQQRLVTLARKVCLKIFICARESKSRFCSSQNVFHKSNYHNTII